MNDLTIEQIDRVLRLTRLIDAYWIFVQAGKGLKDGDLELLEKAIKYTEVQQDG